MQKNPSGFPRRLALGYIACYASWRPVAERVKREVAHDHICGFDHPQRLRLLDLRLSHSANNLEVGHHSHRVVFHQYHYLHATRAELLPRLDRIDDARAAYERALDLVHSEAEQRSSSSG